MMLFWNNEVHQVHAYAHKLHTFAQGCKNSKDNQVLIVYLLVVLSMHFLNLEVLSFDFSRLMFFFSFLKFYFLLMSYCLHECLISNLLSISFI